MNLRWIQFILLYCLACAGTPSHAYRTGDAVDTDVVMDGFLWDALRSQMPYAFFAMMRVLNIVYETFSHLIYVTFFL